MMVLDGYCLWKKSGSPVDIGNIPAIVVVKPTATGSCSSTRCCRVMDSALTNVKHDSHGSNKSWQTIVNHAVDRLNPVTLV